MCKKRVEENEGKLKVVDVNKVKKEMGVKTIDTLSSVIENLKGNFPGLIYMKIPVCNSASPLQTCFDIRCNNLEGSRRKTHCQ